jgi:Asp-tRNA(Asn)/Glu-tRNA(Gln) amidotransferase A subunit family amidase
MSGFMEYLQYDGIGLAELVKSKQVSPSELLDAAIVHIEKTNPAINAVILKMYDRAKDSIKAGLPEGIFCGVPFLL